MSLPIPVRSSEIVAPESGNGSESKELAKLQLLLIEDEPDIAELFVFILEQAGAAVVLAVSAIEGLQKLNTFCPNLLLCNIQLPDHDGIWLLQQIRSDGITQQQLPAIAVTSYTREICGREALAAGFQSFLPKPFDRDQLVQEVLRLTEEHHPSPE